MTYKCKVCGYDQMPHPPANYSICPCCGVEYGLDDEDATHDQLRNEWLRAGAPWFSRIEPYVQPVNWDAWEQVERAGYRYSVPRPQSETVGIRIFPFSFGARQMITPHERVKWVS